MCVIKELPIAGYSVVKESGSRAQAPETSVGRVVRLRRFRGFGATAFDFAAARRQRAGLPSRSPLTRELQRTKAGGEYRARTGDLLVANQALSQLS